MTVLVGFCSSPIASNCACGMATTSPLPPPLGAAGGGAIGKAVVVAARWGATPTSAKPAGAHAAAAVAASAMARVDFEGDAMGGRELTEPSPKEGWGKRAGREGHALGTDE